MSYNLDVFTNLQSEKDDDYKVKENFIISCIVSDIGEAYEILDLSVDEENYDEGVLSQVLHELEYDKYPDLKLSEGCSNTFKLRVTSQYTKDYWGEVDVDIQVEII